MPEFAPALVRWTDDLFPGETPAEKRLRVGDLGALGHRLAVAARYARRRAFLRVLRYPFIGVDHAERAFLAAAISARYAGRPDERWLFPAIGLLSPA